MSDKQREPDLATLFNPRVAEALVTRTREDGFPKLLGMSVDHVEPGVVTASIEHGEKLMNAVGTLHGGAVAALVDHVVSITVYPVIEVGKWAATLDFKINYLGTVTKGRVSATGRIVSLRRKIAVVRVDVENEGELIAVAQGTLYVKERPAT